MKIISALLVMALAIAGYTCKKALDYRFSVYSLLDREAELVAASLDREAEFVAAGTHSAAQVCRVRDELAIRGIDFQVVAMPYRKDLRNPQTGKRRDRPTQNAMKAAAAIRQISHKGIEVIDLGALFARLDDKYNLELWDEDLMHLSELGSDLVGQDIQRRIDSGISKDRSRKLFMGECFAVRFKTGYNRYSSQPPARALRAYGDRGRVASLLFLFEDEYLGNCDSVLWVIPYDLLASTNLPTVNVDKAEKTEAFSTTVTVTADHGVTLVEFYSDLKTMPYPDALVEFPAKIEETGEEVVIVGVCALKRQHMGLMEVKAGDKIVGLFTELDSYLLKNPKISSLAYYRTTDDFLTRRIFVEEWNKSATTINRTGYK